MRTLLLLAVGALVVGCSAPAPTSTVTPSIPAPTRSVATPAPTSNPSATAGVRPTPTEAPVAPDESVGPAISPTEVDWGAVPTFPSPVLVAGGTAVRAAGESGCATLYFESAGSVEQNDGACLDDPVLSLAKAVHAAAGSTLRVKAPQGWILSAQVVDASDPNGPFWIVEAKRLRSSPAAATPLANVGGGDWIELGRGEDFNVVELDAPAPVAPGHYLISVQVQVGQTTREWRMSGRTYYFSAEVS